MAKESPFVKPIARVASGTTLVPREQAVSFAASDFDVTDDPTGLYSDSNGASVEGASVVSLKASTSASSYIRPTGSGGSSGLSIGRWDINSSNPYAPIPGALAIGNDDGSDFSLRIDCGASAITSNFDLTVNGAIAVSGNLAASAGMVLAGGLAITSGGLAVTGNLNAGFCSLGTVIVAGAATGLSVTNDASIGAGLSVTGSAAIGSNLSVGTYIQLGTTTQPATPASGFLKLWYDGTHLKAVDHAGTVTTIF